MSKVLIFSLAHPELVAISVLNVAGEMIFNLSNNERDGMLFDSRYIAIEFMLSLGIYASFYGTRPPRKPK
jgi:hypothetical protein